MRELELNLHGRMDPVVLATAFAEALRPFATLPLGFGGSFRSWDRMKTQREESLLVSADSISEYFGSIPKNHSSALEFSLQTADEEEDVRVSFAFYGENVKQHHWDGHDAGVSFCMRGSWVDGTILADGRRFSPDDVRGICLDVIERGRPEAAHLIRTGDLYFAPSTFLLFHREADRFAHDLLKALRVARDHDWDDGLDGFLESMKQSAGQQRQLDVDQFIERLTGLSRFLNQEGRRLRSLRPHDIRTTVERLSRVRAFETPTGFAVASEPFLHGYLDELFLALLERYFNIPSKP